MLEGMRVVMEVPVAMMVMEGVEVALEGLAEEKERVDTGDRVEWVEVRMAVVVWTGGGDLGRDCMVVMEAM